MNIIRLSLIAMASATVTTALAAQVPSDKLTPAKSRITDEAISRDLSLLRTWKRRADALPAIGAPDDIYAREKARGFLEFAFDEYTDNDRTAIVDDAFAQAVALVRSAEAHQLGNRDTPLIAETSRVRPDLGGRIQQLKGAPGTFACSARPLARAEVQLLRAGHETTDGASCRAAPHEREAERYVREADSLAALCQPPVVPITPVVPAAPAPVAPPKPAPVTPVAPQAREDAPLLEMPRDVHFAFNASRLAPATKVVLDTIAARFRALPTGASMTIVGHTDRYGSKRYNMALSRRRAIAVERYLVAQGIDAARLHMLFRGKLDPAVAGRSRLDNARNRRVEMRVDLAPPPKVRMVDQEEDLQPVH